jgi:hypothetical protein
LRCRAASLQQPRQFALASALGVECQPEDLRAELIE